MCLGASQIRGICLAQRHRHGMKDLRRSNRTCRAFVTCVRLTGMGEFDAPLSFVYELLGAFRSTGTGFHGRVIIGTEGQQYCSLLRQVDGEDSVFDYSHEVNQDCGGGDGVGATD